MNEKEKELEGLVHRILELMGEDAETASYRFDKFKKGLKALVDGEGLSVFIDKYLETGKIIIEQLAIPLEQDYLDISKDVEKFAKKFLDKLFDNCSHKYDFEINYYHVTLFAYMINSGLPKKEYYFNRLSALLYSNSSFSDVYNTLQNIEDISSLYLDKENGNTIIFDFNNINKSNQ